MKFEVGYAKTEGNLKTWDSYYFYAKRGTPVEDILEQASESLARFIDGLQYCWMIGIDHDANVECPQCGGGETTITAGTTADGQRITLANDLDEYDDIGGWEQTGFTYVLTPEDDIVPVSDPDITCNKCGYTGNFRNFIIVKD